MTDDLRNRISRIVHDARRSNEGSDIIADRILAEMGGLRVQSGRLERIIWDAIIWGAQSTPPRHGADYPSYTDSGNSDAETECRVFAARILAAIEPARAIAEGKE